MFIMAVGKSAERHKALDWLGSAVDEGRDELTAQRANDQEIEAWDLACRVAFLVEIVGDAPK